MNMKRSNERGFNDIRNYYNDITLNNLETIKALKEELKERDARIERSDQEVCLPLVTSL